MMLALTFFEDLGRIGQFVWESLYKTEIRLSSALGGMGWCSMYLRFLKILFEKFVAGYIDTFPYRIGRSSLSSGRKTGFDAPRADFRTLRTLCTSSDPELYQCNQLEKL
mgnify:CR=1 FL=1